MRSGVRSEGRGRGPFTGGRESDDASVREGGDCARRGDALGPREAREG